MNQVNLTGNLGSDPEVRFTPSGTAVVKVGLGNNEKYKGETKTTWVNLVVWGKLAELFGQYLHTGSKIRVTGRLGFNEWEKDGVKRKDCEVTVSEMEFLDTKGNGGQRAPAGNPEDDIPF